VCVKATPYDIKAAPIALLTISLAREAEGIISTWEQIRKNPADVIYPEPKKLTFLEIKHSMM